MKIAVVCAAGKEGRLLVGEALSRGHEVTGFVRNADAEVVPGAKKIVKDLFALTREDLRGFDAVIDAFGAWTEETLPLHTASLMHLCDALSGSETRLLVVGGAGSLFVDPAHPKMLMELPSFPELYLPLAQNMGDALRKLRERKDVRWTYLSPAADFRADGARTGRYLSGGEEYFENARGQSAISYADYAVAMIDEAESGRHDGTRFSVVGE